MEITKTCYICKEKKELNLFYNCNNYYCKSCTKDNERKKYLKISKEDMIEYRNKSKDRTINVISDAYIRLILRQELRVNKLCKISDIPYINFPKELIEMKRIQLKTKRLCQQLRN
jgi:hypothetical protein